MSGCACWPKPGAEYEGPVGVQYFDTTFSVDKTISLAHGWAGGPVPALSGYVLGIRPTAPGYRHWVVAPQPGDLRFAQGKAPTPHGPISSRWRRGGGSFKLTVVAPRGTSGVVEIPFVRHAHKIAVDGKVVHVKRRGGVFRFAKVSGQHTFVVG